MECHKFGTVRLKEPLRARPETIKEWIGEAIVRPLRSISLILH